MIIPMEENEHSMRYIISTVRNGQTQYLVELSADDNSGMTEWCPLRNMAQAFFDLSAVAKITLAISIGAYEHTAPFCIEDLDDDNTPARPVAVYMAAGMSFWPRVKSYFRLAFR